MMSQQSTAASGEQATGTKDTTYALVECPVSRTPGLRDVCVLSPGCRRSR